MKKLEQEAATESVLNLYNMSKSVKGFVITKKKLTSTLTVLNNSIWSKPFDPDSIKQILLSVKNVLEEVSGNEDWDFIISYYDNVVVKRCYDIKR